MAEPALLLFAQSLLIGLSIAAPVGPIGLLVIQRTLSGGAALGLATGLGAAVADAAYGAVGAYGVSAVTNALQAARAPLALAGAGFMLWLAWRTWAKPKPATAATAATTTLPQARHLAGAFGGTLLLTLSNPATILSFVAIFAALGAGGAARPGLMVIGVLIGSALWWLLLCALVSALRTRFDARWRRRIDAASALTLAGFAAAVLAGLLR
jgi:threonine/homoserine/homoserine lactone efflux protein